MIQIIAVRCSRRIEKPRRNFSTTWNNYLVTLVTQLRRMTSVCCEAFSLARRKHHCRKCGCVGCQGALAHAGWQRQRQRWRQLWRWRQRCRWRWQPAAQEEDACCGVAANHV